MKNYTLMKMLGLETFTEQRLRLSSKNLENRLNVNNHLALIEQKMVVCLTIH